MKNEDFKKCIYYYEETFLFLYFIQTLGVLYCFSWNFFNSAYLSYGV